MTVIAGQFVIELPQTRRRLSDRVGGVMVTAVLSVTTVLTATPARGQIAGDVVIYGNSGQTGGDVVLRFDRKLTLLSETPLPATSFLEKKSLIATDGLGRRWITWGALGSTDLAGLDASGGLLPFVTLGHNPVNVVAAADGRLFSSTRIPLLTPGALYGIDQAGGVLWSNADGPALYAGAGYPQQLALTSSEQLWLGDGAFVDGGFWGKGLLVQIDPDSGDVLRTFQLPDHTHSFDDGVFHLVGAPDGTLWAVHAAPEGLPGYELLNTDGERVLQAFQVDAGVGGPQADLRVDGQGRLHYRNNWNQTALEYADKLYRYDPANPAAPEAVYQLSGGAQGYALGPTGEEAFAVVTLLPAQVERLDRVNLVTGVKSSVPLDPTWFDDTLGLGDPTGFIYANVVDRQGDNDSDGAPNGVETAAGSNPFDASSRPNGPKVYISYAQSNGALILKYVDPDGILNPTGGLSLGSLSLVSSHHGSIFQYLLSFLTFAQISPDQTEVTALFGALPIPPDKQWQFEATVADKSGAVGWDWQVTPPGDL